jgi:hypothetical protein
MKKTVSALLLSFFLLTAYSQKIATLEVVLDKPSAGLEIPVCTDLDAITYLPDSAIILSEVTRTGKNQVPFQIEAGFPRKLHWVVIPSAGKPGEKHTYELAQGKSEQKISC